MLKKRAVEFSNPLAEKVNYAVIVLNLPVLNINQAVSKADKDFDMEDGLDNSPQARRSSTCLI